MLDGRSLLDGRTRGLERADLMEAYDALLLLSFGGPEGPDDVMPFLENVTRGRGIPKERLEEVAHHYQAFGGVSPINGINRAFRERLEQALRARGSAMRVYWGNRNWAPMLEDTVQQMTADGVKRALVFATSAFGSYSGCRQYVENLAAARAAVDGAPVLDKLRVFFDHPLLVESWRDAVLAARDALPEHERGKARLVFTAHSIPTSMAETGPYVAQLKETARLVADACGIASWDLAYQSRSGPPSVPWLEPDIGDHVEALKRDGIESVIVAPLGFLQDHVEILWDLDNELRERMHVLGMHLTRARSPGEDPRLVSLVLELLDERMAEVPGPKRRSLSMLGAPDVCAASCCPAPKRPARPSA